MTSLQSLQDYQQNSQLIQRARQELARRHVGVFAQSLKPDIQLGWFHLELCTALEQFYADVQARRSPRLMIFAPPRHGKSELVTRLFPAWVLGKNPDMSVISTSYSTDLANRMSRDVQRYIDHEQYRQIFPNTTLGDKQGDETRTASMFEVVGYQGGYRAAGVGTGITGMGADIAIIDDPVKDAQQANSKTYRDMVFEWYQSTLLTRVSAGGGILLVMTRWHVDDLAGRLLESETGFNVLSYRAIADHDEPNRRQGEALDPNRWPIHELESRKRSMSSYTWAALYDQSPVVAGGSLIQGHWFQRYSSLPELRKIIITADTANKTGQQNDYSVFLLSALGMDGNVYLLDMLRGKWTAPDLIQQANDFWLKHRIARVAEFYIEDVQSGTTLIQTLSLNLKHTIKPIKRTRDKFTRLNGVVAQISQGRVYLPSGETSFTDAAWVSGFINECENFTAEMSHANDDQVDTLIDSLETLLIGKATDRKKSLLAGLYSGSTRSRYRLQHQSSVDPFGVVYG